MDCWRVLIVTLVTSSAGNHTNESKVAYRAGRKHKTKENKTKKLTGRAASDQLQSADQTPPT